jgi:NAD(P)-dependent dehydrogenase (short-subunit alcohol dehydrogenase family)
VEQLTALSPLKIVSLDTTDEASVLDAARQLEGVPIDLLVNNAGVWVPDEFQSATKEAFMRQFEVNAVGPFLLTRALLPNLQLAATTHGSAWVAQVSSLLGSIGSNTTEHADLFSKAFGYAASKAALNMVTRSMSVALREGNIGLVTLHPGYVATDLTDHQGYMKPAESAEGMANIVAKLQLEDTGKFLNANKQHPAFELPW